jgi:hypothetical protein
MAAATSRAPASVRGATAALACGALCIASMAVGATGSCAETAGESAASTPSGSGLGGAAGAGASTGAAAAEGGGGAQGGTGGAGGSGGQAGTGGAAGPQMETITLEHRYVPNQMFGGWGPHLGHLVRARASTGIGTSLWFVDDLCSQSPGPSACDVLHDHTLGYFERVDAAWEPRASVALPGEIQQNTATIAAADGDALDTYGVDVGAHTLLECRYLPSAGPAGCAALPFTLGAGSNYLGAAISPQGYRLVWWTGVQDGGGGTFHYVVDYGGGWNGPRSGDAGGYNDASYINIAFGTGPYANEFTMHVQLVSGWAPNWSFLGAVGYGDLGTSEPVSWAMALAPPAGDAVVSTNDVWTDPDSNDSHLVARTDSGAAAYYHRPAGGSWSAALWTLPATYRARFVFAEDRLVLVYGPNGGDLAYRMATKADRPVGSPIAWGDIPETVVTLPQDFGSVDAIYPESPAYQTGAASGIHVALVGSSEQNRVLHVGVEPAW